MLIVELFTTTGYNSELLKNKEVEKHELSREKSTPQQLKWWHPQKKNFIQ
jgi:hypothetical protein